MATQAENPRDKQEMNLNEKEAYSNSLNLTNKLNSDTISSEKPASRAEVTYISPQPPSSKKPRKKEEYTLLNSEYQASLFHNSSGESLAWNRVLTWILALFALALLPFALHFSYKKAHLPHIHHDKIIPTGMQSLPLQHLSEVSKQHHSPHHHHHHYYAKPHQTHIDSYPTQDLLYYQAKQEHPSSYPVNEPIEPALILSNPLESIHNIALNPIPMVSVPITPSIKDTELVLKQAGLSSSSPLFPQPRICVCTVRRLNKTSREILSATKKFPLENMPSETLFEQQKECERLCASERPAMIQELNARASKLHQADSLAAPPSLEEALEKLAFPPQEQLDSPSPSIEDEFMGEVLSSFLHSMRKPILQADPGLAASIFGPLIHEAPKANSTLMIL